MLKIILIQTQCNAALNLPKALLLNRIPPCAANIQTNQPAITMTRHDGFAKYNTVSLVVGFVAARHCTELIFDHLNNSGV